MQNKIVLHEICASRSRNPEAVTSLLRDANDTGTLPPQLHEIAADVLETVIKCCDKNRPRRDFIEIGSAIMVKMVIVLMQRGVDKMMNIEQTQKNYNNQKESK